jgi:hypothetical protein
MLDVFFRSVEGGWRVDRSDLGGHVAMFEEAGPSEDSDAGNSHSSSCWYL